MSAISTLTYSELTAYYNFNAKKSGDLLGMHIHQNYELFCILSGQTQYYVEGMLYDLGAGDLFLIGKGESHKNVGKAPHPNMSRVIIQFNDGDVLDSPDNTILSFLHGRSAGQGTLFPAAQFKDKPWIYYFRQIADVSDLHARRIFLSAILQDLCLNFSRIDRHHIPVRSRIAEILHYINTHLHDDLSVDSLCRRFLISHTYLNQKILELSGVTSHEYITSKRMLWAQDHLHSGTTPTLTATAVGYHDYSAFYRAYKTHFGHPPSHDYQKK